MHSLPYVASSPHHSQSSNTTKTSPPTPFSPRSSPATSPLNYLLQHPQNLSHGPRSSPTSPPRSSLASRTGSLPSSWPSSPAGVTYPSMLGEMYSAAFNAPAFNWLCSPACTELETVVLDWLCQALGLPSAYLSTSQQGGGGVIQGSASEAIVTCMVAARERYLHARCDAENLPSDSAKREDRIGQLRSKLISFSTDQTHSSTQKGARIAGTRHMSIPTSAANNLSLTGDDLASALDKCKQQGLEPYYITLTLGTTSTCSIDDFASLIPVLAQHPNLWVHVDAAYAGAALILPQYQKQYCDFFGHFDSFNMNMHKWLLVNFDASCLFVQNRRDLTRALSISAAYYTNKHSDSGLVTDYRDWQIPLGRRFRALKIWFVMRSYGIKGMQEHIERTIGLGEMFAEWVRRRGDLFEIVGRPIFALTCFRIRPEAVSGNGSSESKVLTNGVAKPTPENAVDPVFEPPASKGNSDSLANALTQIVIDRITERGEIFLTGSSAAGKTFLRVVSANPNAEEKYVRQAWEDIVGTSEEVLKEFKEGRLDVKVMQNGAAH